MNRNIYSKKDKVYINKKTNNKEYFKLIINYLKKYKTKDEVEEYKKIDPITKVKELILSKKYASKKQIEEIDASVKAKVKECEEFAENSPYPEKSLMYDAVYEQANYPFLKHKI